MSLELEIRNATEADWPGIAALLADSGLPLDGAREHLDHFAVDFDTARANQRLAISA